MERPGDRYPKSAPFTCPKCGETKILPAVGNRKLCPECREVQRKLHEKEYHIARREVRKARDAEKAAQKKQNGEGASKPAPPKKQPAELTLDERIQLQIKLQCRKCDWWSKGDGGCDPCCVYYIRHGVGYRVDHGNGPGDCRMFLPKGSRLRKTKIDDGQRHLAQTEADFMGSKPRKEDKENATR